MNLEYYNQYKNNGCKEIKEIYGLKLTQPTIIDFPVQIKI